MPALLPVIRASGLVDDQNASGVNAEKRAIMIVITEDNVAQVTAVFLEITALLLRWDRDAVVRHETFFFLHRETVDQGYDMCRVRHCRRGASNVSGNEDKKEVGRKK